MPKGGKGRIEDGVRLCFGADGLYHAFGGVICVPQLIKAVRVFVVRKYPRMRQCCEGHLHTNEEVGEGHLNLIRVVIVPPGHDSDLGSNVQRKVLPKAKEDDELHT